MSCGAWSILGDSKCKDGRLMLQCSDAFAGGFMAAIVEGKSLDEAVNMGHWLASLSIKELGPQYVPPCPQFRSLGTLPLAESVLIPLVLQIPLPKADL